MTNSDFEKRIKQLTKFGTTEAGVIIIGAAQCGVYEWAHIIGWVQHDVQSAS